MTVKEMHIQFSLGLQKLGANSRRKFYPEEIDNILNTAQDAFIRDQVKVTEDARGFLSTQIDVDKLRPIIVRDHETYAAKTTSLGKLAYTVPLPADYAYLISDSWYSAKACSTVVEGTEAEFTKLLPMYRSAKVAAPFYETVKITFDGADILNLAFQATQDGANSLYTGVRSKDERFYVRSLILDIFNERMRNGLLGASIKGLYWERYKDKYYPNHFILVSTTDKAANIVLDAESFGYVGADTSFTKSTATTHYVVAGRQVKPSVIDQVLTMPFYGPTPKSPISVLSGTTITVFPHKSCIVNKASLSYVRKASRIDLSLHRNCELAPEFHQTVVDMAVEYAAGRLEQQALYQVSATENLKNK